MNLCNLRKKPSSTYIWPGFCIVHKLRPKLILKNRPQQLQRQQDTDPPCGTVAKCPDDLKSTAFQIVLYVGIVGEATPETAPGAGWPEWANFRQFNLHRSIFFIYKCSPKNWASFFTEKGYVLCVLKKCWATFLANFSQNNPVTLPGSAAFYVECYASFSVLVFLA
jgi:hypothetical protein